MKRPNNKFNIGDVVYYKHFKGVITDKDFFNCKNIWIYTVSFDWNQEVDFDEEDLTDVCDDIKVPKFNAGDDVIYDNEEMKVLCVKLCGISFAYELQSKDGYRYRVRESSLSTIENFE